MGVSSDPPSGYALSARSFALGGRSKLRPGPIGSISRKETASYVLPALGIHGLNKADMSFIVHH